jgi:hypothetical protein
MRERAERYGAPPSSYDWSRTHARRRGGEALRRLERHRYPSPATVKELLGGWAAARRAAFPPLRADGP